jgi:glycosyltransferase involved in cell wall biosynthesis
VRFDRFGADVLLTYLYRLRPEILVTLADIWWLTYIANPGIANFMRTANIPWVHYYPVDGDMGDGRLPPSWVHILRTVDLPVAMSKYGRDVTQTNGVVPSYVPHGVDCSVFRPPEDKKAAKRALGYDDRFVVLSDARNQPRKLLPRLLDIFGRFAHDKPDALLHLHCDPSDPAARSPEYTYGLSADIDFLGLSEKVRITEAMSIAKGVSLEALAAIYQAADVHLLTSWGEGFGLPTLQAAACGVVPMASDYTASRELTEGHGESIRVRDFIPDEFGIQRALIDPDDAVSRLDGLYQDRGLLAARSAASARFALDYAWDRVIDEWDRVLRQEMPRAHQHLARPVTTSRVTLVPDAGEGPSTLNRMVRQAVPGMPDGATVTMKVAESKPGEFISELFRDAGRLDRRLTIPVTLPVDGHPEAKGRTTGLTYLAGPRDVDAFLLLLLLFPGLAAWSTVPLDLGYDGDTGTPRRAVVVEGAAGYRRALAQSTLALDLEGTDGLLPELSAELGVPCVRLRTEEGLRLWPELALDKTDPAGAARVARVVLTDQGVAQSACASAKKSLVALHDVPGRRVC